MASIVPDASFLVHALLPAPLTYAASTAFDQALSDPLTVWHIPAGVYLEFGSFLRKSTNRRALSGAEAERLVRVIQNLPADRVSTTPTLMERAWQVSVQLQQSDIFDSFELAVAEQVNAEFWTSDLRFANASAALGGDRVKYIS